MDGWDLGGREDGWLLIPCNLFIVFVGTYDCEFCCRGGVPKGKALLHPSSDVYKRFVDVVVIFHHLDNSCGMWIIILNKASSKSMLSLCQNCLDKMCYIVSIISTSKLVDLMVEAM